MLEVRSNKNLSFIEKLYVLASHFENFGQRALPEIRYVVDSSIRETVVTEV